MKLQRTWREGDMEVTGLVSREQAQKMLDGVLSASHCEVYVAPLDHTELPVIIPRVLPPPPPDDPPRYTSIAANDDSLSAASARFDARQAEAEEAYSLQLERIRAGYDAQMKPHLLIQTRNRERAQEARWKAWRYYAALWIALDAIMTVLALYYAVTHGARPF